MCIKELASKRIRMVYRGRTRLVPYQQMFYLKWLCRHRDELTTDRLNTRDTLTLLESDVNSAIAECYPIKNTGNDTWHMVNLHLTRRKLLLETGGSNSILLSEDFDRIILANTAALRECDEITAQLKKLLQEKEGCTNA